MNITKDDVLMALVMAAHEGELCPALLQSMLEQAGMGELWTLGADMVAETREAHELEDPEPEG